MKSLQIALGLILLSFFSMAQPPVFRVSVYDSASTGYYFLAANSTLMILDGHGDVVYYKNGPHGNGFCIQPNGLMSYSDNLKSYMMDSTFTIVDSVQCKNVDEYDSHDMQILPNGHFLVLGSDLVVRDLSPYYWGGQFGSNSAIVESTVVQEQDANKNVVFEWRAKNYFNFNEADTFYLFPGVQLYNTWTHANSVELDTDGNIIVSIRNFNEITKINRSDSSVMWRLGGNLNDFTFINSPVPFYGQHAARRLPNGHILFLDNGYNYTSHGAQALEFELDEINKTATQTWSYVFNPALSSRSQGNAQRLANSNTVIDFGSIGADTVCFVVVDSNGTKIFQLDGLLSYRAFNYPSLPWQLHRPQISCFDSLGVTYLDAGAGYASYAWNNGDSARVIPVTAVQDTFYVFVPYGQGGYISSAHYIVSDTSNLCSPLSIPFLNQSHPYIKVFPNPVQDKLSVSMDAKQNDNYILNLEDMVARLIISKNISASPGNNSFELDLHGVAKGIYMLHIQSSTDNWKTKVVVE